MKAQQIQQLKARQQVLAQGQVQAAAGAATTQAAAAGTTPVQKTVAVNAQLITSVAQTQASQTPQPTRLQVVQVKYFCCITCFDIHLDDQGKELFIST